MADNNLPFGSEFSPSIIVLSEVLEMAEQNGGDVAAFETAARKKYFDRNRTSASNKQTLAYNLRRSLISYGIMDEDGNLTDFGKALRATIDPDEQHAKLAQHILLNLHGVTLVQCIQDMQASGATVKLTTIREELGRRGIHFPPGGKHASMMRLWLEKAGVFVQGYQVNTARLEELTGTTEEEIEALATLSAEQKAYLKTLANIGTPGPHISRNVQDLAEATFGVKYDEKSAAAQVIYPLERFGYITVTKTNRSKSPLITTTSKLEADVIIPLLDQLEKQVGAAIRKLIRKPLGEILKDLISPSKHVKGLALEALAFKLMRLIDLTYVATRLRGVATGGAEVDLIFEGARLVFSRWQIQCKNTGSVSLDDVAKEVGLTHALKSNVIVMVSTGKIGPEARKYANKVMQDSNLCVVMVDGSDIKAIEKNPAYFVEVLNREAKHAMKLKTLTFE